MGELPVYDLPDLKGSSFNQLGQFEDIVTQANVRGIVNHVPESPDETFDFKSQQIRIYTISSRLHHLGYLPVKIPTKQLEENKELIKQAVLEFQKDAGLKEDSWVGDITWRALDELIGFDSELTYDNWFVDDQIKPEVWPAMHRAIHLRIASLGLYAQRITRDLKVLNKMSLSKLAKVFRILRIKGATYKPDFDYDTISVLFDHDKLIKAIANFSVKKGEEIVFDFESCDSEKDIQLTKKFISNSAKIELWLLGFDLPIDGQNDFDYKKRSDIWKTIRDYYKKFEGKKGRIARSLAENFSPLLFHGFDLAEEEVDKYESDDASEEVYKYMMPKEEEKRKSILNNAWLYIKEKGMRLWDGLKRIWRWIKRKGKQLFKFLRDNVFKAFYRFISKAYKIVTKGIKSVVQSIGIYIRGGMVSDQVLFSFSKDMDSEIYFEANLTSENGEKAIERLQKQSKSFVLGCKIIGFVFNIFKNVLTGVFGWAKLLFSLLKSYKDIKLIYRDFKEVAAFT